MVIMRGFFNRIRIESANALSLFGKGRLFISTVSEAHDNENNLSCGP